MVRLSNLDRARALGVLQGGQTIELNWHFLISFTLLGYNFLILLSPKTCVNLLFSFVYCYCLVNHWSFAGK